MHTSYILVQLATHTKKQTILIKRKEKNQQLDSGNRRVVDHFSKFLTCYWKDRKSTP